MEALIPLGLALLLGGVVLGLWSLRLRELARPERAAFRRYLSRVALAGLGLSIALIAAVDLVLVGPRRRALIRAYDAQLQRVVLDEAAQWGGALQDAMRRRLEESPDRPGPG